MKDPIPILIHMTSQCKAL